MKKSRIALPLALLAAGALVLGGCGEKPHTPEVTLGEDGYVYLDGVKTDVFAGTESEAPETKSAFELWKEENPSYTGTEAEWEEWLAGLLEPEEPPQEETVEYKIIENGVFGGETVSGTAAEKNGALVLSNAVLRLPELAVLPLWEGSSWEVDIMGKLLTGSAGGAQFFACNPFSDEGRVYFGVNKSSKMLYVGVRLGATYVNYGWEFDDAAYFTQKHSYKIAYEDGIYTLSKDGGTAQKMGSVNFNQNNKQWLGGTAAEEGANLNKLIRTVLAQDAAGMTNLGVDGFTWNAEIENFTVKTSSAGGYKNLSSHPLAGKRIFYLGSSITYGAASGGVAFGEILHSVTNNPFAKEAVSGTTLVDNGADSYVQRLKKLDFSQRPDYLVVQLSTNDFTQNKPSGSVQGGTASSGFDTSTISGAIQYIIAYAKEQCPTCEVVLYTGAVRSTWDKKADYEKYINGDFTAICNKWNIEPLDIFHTPYQQYTFFWNDDIHPVLEGYAFGWTPLFAEYFMEKL